MSFWNNVFHPIDAMSRFLDEKVFKTKTEEEIVAEHMQEAQREAKQAARVIRDHMFTEHMARARIKALEDWNHQRNLHCTVRDAPSGRAGHEGL